MLKTVGAREARLRLSGLLDEVGRGASVVITRRGEPVAMLVPVPKEEKADPRQTIRKPREFRKGILLGGASIRKMIEEGRRRRTITERLRAARERGPALGTKKIVAALRKDRERP